MLTIEIISDVVCPWCFLGKRRLEAAIVLLRRQRPDFVCRKIWRPFFLNPDTPSQGEPYLPYLEHKFGGRAQVEAIWARIRAAGREEGIDYAFEKIRLRANTLNAHRLIHWAQQQGDADRLVERLFVAQFQRGEDVGDAAELARIAAECGYDAAAVQAYLASDRDTQAVRELEQRARDEGITAVPTFVTDGRRAIVGAESPALIAAAISPG